MLSIPDVCRADFIDEVAEIDVRAFNSRELDAGIWRAVLSSTTRADK